MTRSRTLGLQQEQSPVYRPSEHVTEIRSAEPIAAPGDAAARFRSSPLPTTDDPAQGLLALLPELRLVIGLVTAGCLIAALYYGRAILIPLALAIFLGFVLDPLVVRLKRLGLPRAPAVVVVTLATLLLLAGMGLFLANQVSMLGARLPTYQDNIVEKVRLLREDVEKPGMFDGVVKTFETFRREINQAVAPAAAQSVQSSASGAPLPPRQVVILDSPRSPIDQATAWLKLGGGPLATAGIVLVFLVLILLDRLDLRDRMLRLWGGSLQRSTDALDEAGARISRYLTMQLVVNASFGVPLAAGLWLIGVPGAMLWGVTAIAMRFVPYVGPMISAAFPLTLAFAIDPTWDMVLWTGALIAGLQLVVTNIVAPWLYGASTGLSAISLMAAAIFWTAIWGPVGLVMSTPLTVCLLVIGRYLPRLQFLDVLLGSQPALDTSTRIYQRLLAGEVEEAIELAHEGTAGGEVAGFYDRAGLGVLRMANKDRGSASTAHHRHRIVIGMDALLDDLVEQHPGDAKDVVQPVLRPLAVCIGARWEVDTLAARMVAHASALAKVPAEHRPAAIVNADYIARLDLDGVRTVLLSSFSPDPKVAARHFCRRLRRRWPDVHIILGLWNAPAELLGAEAARELGADAVVTSVGEALVRIVAVTGVQDTRSFVPAAIPADDAVRLEALRGSGALDPRAAPLFEAAAKRAADIFDVPLAMVTLIDEDRQRIGGAHGAAVVPDANGQQLVTLEELAMPRPLSVCGHVVANLKSMVVPDVARDLRFVGNPALAAKGVRFYAGAPLREAGGQVLGSLCLLDVQPRSMTQRELRLLEAMADDLMQALRASASGWDATVLPLPRTPEEPPIGASAIVGQPVPAT